jgi:hypothetical protein
VVGAHKYGEVCVWGIGIGAVLGIGLAFWGLAKRIGYGLSYGRWYHVCKAVLIDSGIRMGISILTASQCACP